MLNLALCSHVPELEGEFSFWKKFAELLSEKLDKKVSVVTFRDYVEEKLKLSTNSYDIYYANPVISYELYKKGYRPIARLKGESNTFVVVGNKEPLDNHATVTTTFIEVNFLPVLVLEHFDFIKTKLSFEKSQKDVYKKVKEEIADFGILFKNFYSEIKDKNKPPVVTEVHSNLKHTLMVKPELYQRLKEVVENLPNLKLIDDNEFFEGLTERLPIVSFLKTKELIDITKAIHNNPYVGIAIYKDKIVYLSENLRKLLGYSLEELQNLRPQDIVADEYKSIVEEAYNRRLSGEFFSKGYEYIKLKTKDGRYIYTFVFGSTIVYKNSYAGLLFLIDVTKEVLFRKLYSVLRDINRAITTVLTEKELFDTVCQTLVKELDIKYVQIEVLDEKSKSLKVKYKCGKENYLNFNERKSKLEPCAVKAYKEKKVVVSSLAERDKEISLSSASIPIMKNGKVYAVLSIYSNIPLFYEEVNKSLLSELSHDLSFTLEKIESIKNLILLKTSIEKAPEWVIITDKNGKIEYINDYVCKISGYSKEEVIGRKPSIFKSGYHQKEFYKKLWETILSGKEFNAVFVNRAKNGRIFYLEQRIFPATLPDGEVKFIALGRDITKEKILLEENEQLKYYDILTGVYNSNGFTVQVEEFINQNPDKFSALIIIDIANFSYINKTFGTEFGDEVLRIITKILRKHFKKNDIIGRIGGDEFGIFVKNLRKKENLFLIIERLKDILNRYIPIKINSKEINLVIHGGAAVYPYDGKNFRELLQNAIIALKAAKRMRGSSIKIYNKELEKSINSFLKIESLLYKAIRENLFLFHYQPYFDAKTQEVVGFESLVRIRDKNGQIHYPNEFIHILEQSEYLSPFRNWALRKVTDKIREWKKTVSINISARTFKNMNFPNEVLKYVSDLPAPLVLEITERLYISEIEKSKRIIEKLKECKNVRIAIDDFGTGYSSLSYLKDLNVDILKIDISFVRAMVKDKKSKAIVKAVISLAKDLGIKTLAEGVETEEQFEVLKDMGIDYIQGFYFSKPLPEEEVERLLRN